MAIGQLGGDKLWPAPKSGMERTHAGANPHVQAFVEQLLNAGYGLVIFVDRVTEALAEQGSTRDDPSEFINMMTASIALRLTGTPAADIDRASELFERTMNAVLADLAQA